MGSTRKRLVSKQDKVFGQKVGAEISCSGLRGREDRAGLRNKSSRRALTARQTFGYFSDMQKTI